MGTKLGFSATFHPQTDEQSKKTIQTLEDVKGMRHWFEGQLGCPFAIDRVLLQ